MENQIDLLQKQPRPTVNDVRTLLQERESLVVHFSGAPACPTRNTVFLYPNDLRHILSGRANGGISCSTVKPTDNFYGLNRNAVGCIGVIVDFRCSHSIIDALPTDQGSILLEDGTRWVENIRPLSILDVEKSINERAVDSYNEWVIRDFDCVGILAVKPYEITKLSQSEAHTSTSDLVTGIWSTSLDEVCRDFPGQNVYTFIDGRIVDVKKSEAVEISDIYRCK